MTSRIINQCDARGCTNEQGTELAAGTDLFARVSVKGEFAHVFRANRSLDLCPQHLEEFKKFFKPTLFEEKK
jgi:hypothetical protein